MLHIISIYIYKWSTYISSYHIHVRNYVHVHTCPVLLQNTKQTYLSHQSFTARGLSDSLTPTPVAGSKPGLTPSTGLAANSTACKLVMLKDEDPWGVCDTVWMRQKCSVGSSCKTNQHLWSVFDISASAIIRFSANSQGRLWNLVEQIINGA